MTIASFDALLDRHGGDTAHWPTPDRDAALMLLTTSAEARRSLQAMRDAEAVLASTRASAPAIDRIADIASRHRQTRPIPAAARRVGWAAAAIVMLVVGMAVGDIRSIRDDGMDTVLAASLDSVGATDVD